MKMQPQEQDRLRQVLDAYGRNPLRWPERDRVRFAGLLRSPAELPADIAAEADTLDKLLDRAGPSAVPEPQGAQARLLQKVAAQARIAGDGRASAGVRFSWRDMFQPQALFTASVLVVGIIAGIVAGADADTGFALADILQLSPLPDDIVDTVLLTEGDDGGIL